MGPLQHVTGLLFAAAALMAAAAAFLFYEAARGVPYGFGVELALAALVGLVVPLGAVALFRRLAPKAGPAVAYCVFVGAAAIVAVIFGLAAA